MTAPKKPARRAIRFISQERWAILRESLQLIIDIACRDHQPDFEAVMTKRGDSLEESERTVIRNRTAVIPVSGPIFRYANFFTEISGASSIQMLAEELRQAEDSPLVDNIVLHMDTPGGQVNGTSEFAQMVRECRKPVYAYVGGMAASAGYWIASAAKEIVLSKTGQVGSIGVVSTVWLDDDEERVEIVSTQSPGKRPDVRTEDGRAQIQQQTDALAQIFIDTIAENRDVDPETVMSDFGRGGMLIGQAAVDAGMADRVGSLEGLIAELAGPASSPIGDIYMSTAKKGPVSVSSTAELRLVLAAGHTGDEITIDVAALLTAAEAKGHSAGLIQGAANELKRIQDVESAVLPGHERLIAGLKFDGKTTGPEAAAQVIAAERARLGRRVEDLNADAGQARVPTPPSPSDAGAGGPGKPQIDKNLPVEDRCKAEWQHDPEIRAEFGTVEAYTSYMKAKEGGKVRVLRDRVSRG